ncbi:MAG: carbohydrate-binding family 9-like protein [Capsulimonadaceae bacterium]|nr:carbohydrate-binding family 9-like protein [Capsulimonadaceae bacterium]
MSNRRHIPRLALAGIAALLAACRVQALPSVDVPRCTVAPLLTASPGDPAWKNAGRIESLPLMRGPRSAGQEPTTTHVLLLWDDARLYVRFVCDDRDIVVSRPGKPLFSGDTVEFFIDPVGDAREFVELQINPDNARTQYIHLITAPVVASDDDGVLCKAIMQRDDWTFTEDGMPGLVTATNRVATAVDGEGWLADIAVPAAPLLRRLEGTHFAPMALRMNFVRYNCFHGAAPVAMAWSPVVWGRPHRSPQRMGTLRLVASDIDKDSKAEDKQ